MRCYFCWDNYLCLELGIKIVEGRLKVIVFWWFLFLLDGRGYKFLLLPSFKYRFIPIHRSLVIPNVNEAFVSFCNEMKLTLCSWYRSSINLLSLRFLFKSSSSLATISLFLAVRCQRLTVLPLPRIERTAPHCNKTR